eukprot:GEZU01017753.1.p1 GENE.GEZU01017753.1~~GEZU01017753.1.p1  ORF type:complete len:178 (-),score=19.69 GEZU01017753.1:388-888(-)
MDERIKRLEHENEQLRKQLLQMEEKLALAQQQQQQPRSNNNDTSSHAEHQHNATVAPNEPISVPIRSARNKGSLNNDQIMRYCRQLLLPDIGVKGQTKLINSSVLIVGAGGLGSPVALYLAAAGVGKLGIVDYDSVDKSNLHRQIIHTEHRIGLHKAISAKFSCLA